MIKTMTAKIDGQIITFASSNGVNWVVTSVAPDTEGVYPVTLTVTTTRGNTHTFTADDAEFSRYLNLYVSNRSTNLIEYLPHFLHEVVELQETFRPIDYEIDILFPYIESMYAEAVVSYCSDERIKEWEKDLHITPIGTIDERRLYIKAMLRGGGKLNEAKIKSVVNAFTGGGDARVLFEDSTIIVQVLPPDDGEVYRFLDVERALKPLIPAHLNLLVERYYSTWGDVSTQHTSWDSVTRFGDWGSVRKWVAP